VIDIRYENPLSGSNATSVWAARLGLNLQSSTLKDDETGEPLHVQRKQIDAYREAWMEAGHERQPRVSVSRSIFALTTDTDRAYFAGDGDSRDQIGMIDESTRAIFGRSYAAEPDALVEQLRTDEAIQAADTLLLTVPNQLGVEYNAHVIENILTHVAPTLGWRQTHDGRHLDIVLLRGSRARGALPSRTDSPSEQTRGASPLGRRRGRPHPRRMRACLGAGASVRCWLPGVREQIARRWSPRRPLPRLASLSRGERRRRRTRRAWTSQTATRRRG
jgi:hypothetical protein